MKKIEYKMLNVNELIKIASKTHKDGNVYERLYQTANELGKEGWELCGIFDNPIWILTKFYFKREL